MYCIDIYSVNFQSGHVWGNSLTKDPTPVSPCGWGWKQDSPEKPYTPVYIITYTISRQLPTAHYLSMQDRL